MDLNNDLKNDIAAAMDAAASPPEPIPDTPPQAPPQAPAGLDENPPPIGDRPQKARDERGRFAKGEPAKEAKEAATPQTGETPPEKPAEPPKEPVAAQPPAPEQTQEKPKLPLRAPASWKPTVRENWDKVPEPVQQEVIRREREVAMALQETAEARQGYQKFKEIVSPYEPLFRAEGVDPIQGVSNLMRTAAMLASGPAPTKAQVIANLIKTYQVDIPTLDSLLQGQPVPQQATQTGPIRDPRLDQLLQQAEQMRSQRERELQAKAQEQIAEIQHEEFFEDVREDMADILEVARRRGVPLSIRDAYNRAVALNPEVSRVVEQRKAAAASQNVQRSMAASSSVRAQPAAAVSVPSSGSLRDDLENALSALNKRS